MWLRLYIGMQPHCDLFTNNLGKPSRVQDSAGFYQQDGQWRPVQVFSNYM